MNVWSVLTGGLIDSVGNAIDKLVTSDEERLQLKNELTIEINKFETTAIKAQSSIITAEANSKSWLAASWRPITMLVFVFIIANNYILVPYATVFGAIIPTLEIPPDMWTLLQLGLTGYIVGRSGEKMMKTYKGG